MEHDMTEQKREPKSGEWWWVHHANEVEVGYMRHAKWMLCGMTGLADATPIAPVINHELARGLVDAVNAGRIALSNRDRNDLDEAAYKMLRFILAKADLAGLGE